MPDHPHSSATPPVLAPPDPDALQIHLSLEHPSGEHVARLRNHYADHPETVTDAHACIDQCNDYIEFILHGCLTCGRQLTTAGHQPCSGHQTSRPDTGPLQMSDKA